MGQSKTLPFYRLILLWYFLTDGASSEYCFNDEDDTVENCSYGCCTSENFKHCCTSPYVIAGIVCGSVGGVCTIVALILCCRYYKKQRAQVVNNPQIQPAMVLSGNVPQQQYNGYNTGYNSQYNGTPPTSYSHQAQYPPAPSGLSVPPAYTYVPPSSDLSAATANNPFAAAANQAAGRTPTAK